MTDQLLMERYALAMSEKDAQIRRLESERDDWKEKAQKLDALVACTEYSEDLMAQRVAKAEKRQDAAEKVVAAINSVVFDLDDENRLAYIDREEYKRIVRALVAYDAQEKKS